MIVERATSIQKVALDDSIIARRCHAGDSFNSDLIDSATQALKYLRDVGMAETDEEEQRAKIGMVMHRSRPKRLYPC